MSRFVWLAGAIALTALGCASRKSPPQPVYPVTGVVTYQGRPVAGADVTFFNAEQGRSAFGRTDDQGKYRLTTFSSNDGAVAGKHVVTVVKPPPPVAAAPQPNVESTEYVPPGLGESTEPPPPKSDFPEKYGKPESSGLVAMVHADAPNEFDLKLTD